MSRNSITIDQLNLACRHGEEMKAARVTENLAIRTLELFTDVYAKLLMGGSATPHRVDQIELWSVKAKSLKKKIPNGKPKNLFWVEHGTARREFARKALGLYQKGRLNEKSMRMLVNHYWKLAVITLEEDQRLNTVARSTMFKTPAERWAAAGIHFRAMSLGKIPRTINRILYERASR
jgi:hypothetical protein